MLVRLLCSVVKTQRRFQWLFLVSVLTWIGVLQAVMLWYISKNQFALCNASGAWPLALPLLGNGLLTLLFTLVLSVWAWNNIGHHPTEKTFFLTFGSWSLILGTGFSHALERLVGGCVIDYWTLPLFSKILSLNLGDVALTFGAITFGVIWLLQRKKSQ